ncbi:MAG TPA: hypothetical protein VGW38_16865 [Chloroflexota bacterium]|nr:hypothetical protein [Chloroflexota bacterium]
MAHPGPAHGYLPHFVLAFLRTHAGTAFTVEEICQQVGSLPSETQHALARLAHDGLVQQEGVITGADRYRYAPH